MLLAAGIVVCLFGLLMLIRSGEIGIFVIFGGILLCISQFHSVLPP